MIVVTNHSDLSQTMRSALVDRSRVRRSTADALARRGLAEPLEIAESWLGGYTITLTAAGEKAREAQFPPVGATVRNTKTGWIGTVAAIHRGRTVDSVELDWGNGSPNSAGSPAYLEVVQGNAEQDDVDPFANIPNADDSRNRQAARTAQAAWAAQAPQASAEPQAETVTITVPRHLAEAVTAAWNEAYRAGLDNQAARFDALADAYAELRAEAPQGWLSLALMDAHDDATRRAINERKRTSVCGS